MTKRAIVTGAGAGIGAATAQRLALAGHEVHAVDLNPDIAHNPPAGAIKGYQCDIGDPQQVERVCSEILTGGPVTILVNSAGMMRKGNAEACSLDDFDRIMAVNVRGAWLFAQLVLPGMREIRDGSIVSLASTSAIKPPKDRLAYSTSKAALLAVTRSIATDFGEYGIRANAVCPGPIGTEIWRDSRPEHLTPEQHQLETTKTLALPRLGTVDEVASMIEYLTSDAASYVTGATLTIDGGRTFH